MTVAFIGNRELVVTQTMKDKLKRVIEGLIVDERADEFLFGSRSRFNDLCYEVVTELKSVYGHIRRINVRAEYEYVGQWYIDDLLTEYERSFFPESVHGAGAKAYVERNAVMVDMCDVLLFYLDPSFVPRRGKSGTGMAVAYAARKKKRVIDFYGLLNG